MTNLKPKLGLALLVGLAAGVSSRAQTVTLTIDGPEIYRVTFDTQRISEPQMKRLLIVSPYAGYSMLEAPALESCTAADRRYYTCGSRDLTDPNFFRNAEVNLELGKQSVTFLEQLAYPADLAPVVRYEERLLSFFLWLQQTRLAFYQSWDIDVLKTTYDGVDATQQCAAAVDRIKAARSAREKYSLALYGWHNCMNDAFQDKLGPYPAASWDAFLKDYGITDNLSSDVPY